MLNAIIIEDEAHNRALLREMLAKHCPEISVVEEAVDVPSGIELVHKLSFDLLFLDVEMPGGNGFDILESINNVDFELIFVTAHGHYALEAIRFCALDYILKPLKVEDLQKAVYRVMDRRREKKENLLLKQLLSNRTLLQSQEKRIALPTTDQILLIPIKDIIRCQGESNYTHFFLKEGRKILVAKTLREYEELLQDYDFIRTHQSHLINLREVEALVKSDGGYVLMKDGSKVSVSRRRREEVLERLLKL